MAGWFSLTALTACATDGRGRVDPSLEQPRYTVLGGEGRFELRAVEPFVVAETTVQGAYDAATRDAFRILASYIFGKNEGENSIAMTAPVATERTSPTERGVAIAMTAPVDTRRVDAAAPSESTTSAQELGSLDDSGTWTTRFMMPSRYTIETLPRPKDPRIRFVEQPGRCVGVVVFNGFVTDAHVAQERDALTAWLRTKGLKVTGPESLARYNDPFTLPWNRRNEVQVEVEPCGVLPEADPGAVPGPSTGPGVSSQTP